MLVGQGVKITEGCGREFTVNHDQIGTILDTGDAPIQGNEIELLLGATEKLTAFSRHIEECTAAVGKHISAVW